MTKIQFSLISLLSLVAASCKSTKSDDEPAVAIFTAATLDTTSRPGDDFFEYVNAKWIAGHPIPADRASFGSFHLLAGRVPSLSCS